MKRNLIKGIAAAGVLALALAGCGTATSGSALGKVSCGVQMVKWYHKGGKADIVILRNNLRPMVTAARNHQQGEIATDAAGVKAASNTLQAHLPPNCVPGLDAQIKDVLVDTNRAASNAQANDLKAMNTDAKDAEKHMKQAGQTIHDYLKRK